MVLTPQNSVSPLTPNAVFIPTMIASTRIAGGKLITGLNVSLQLASVANPDTDQENWLAAGGPVNVQIVDAKQTKAIVAGRPAAEMSDGTRQKLASAVAAMLDAVNSLNADLKLV
jgi:hypothetical protein